MELYLHSSITPSWSAETTLPLPVPLPLLLETFLNQNYYHYINVCCMLIRGILMGLQVWGYIKIFLQAVEK
jgi:hypothetical protein